MLGRIRIMWSGVIQVAALFETSAQATFDKYQLNKAVWDNFQIAVSGVYCGMLWKDQCCSCC